MGMGKALLLACGISAAATGVGGYWLYDNNSREFPKPDTVCGRYSTLSFDEDIPRVPRAAVMYELDPEYTSLLGLQEKANQLRQEHSGPNNPHAIGGVDFSVEGEVTKERVAVAILTGVLEAHLERKANRLEQHYLSGRYTTAINREPDNTYSTQGYYYDALLAAKAYREIATPCKSTEVYLYGVPGGIEIGALAGICERAYNEEKTFINQGNLDQVIDFLSEETLVSLGECLVGKKRCVQRFLRDLVKEDIPFAALEEILDRVAYGFSIREVQEEINLKVQLYRKFIDYVPVIPYECACSPLSSYSPMERESLQSSLQARLDKLVEADRNDSPYPTSSSSAFPVVSLFNHNRFSLRSSDGFNYNPIVSRLCMNTTESSPEEVVPEPEPVRNICAEKESEGISYRCVNRTDVGLMDGNEEIQLKNSLCMWFDVIDSNQGLARLSLHRMHWASGIAFKVTDYLINGNRESYEEYVRIRDRRLSDFPHLFEVYDAVIDHCKCRVPFRRQHRF